MTVNLTPERGPGGQEDYWGCWRTVLPNEFRRLEGLIAQTNTVVNAALIIGSSYQLYADSTVPTGNTITNSSAPISFASSYLFPANSIVAGQSFRIKLYGVFSLIAATGTVQLQVILGGQTVLDTGSETIAGGFSNGGFCLEGDLFITAIGTSGQIEAQGTAQFGTPVQSGHLLNLPNATPFTVNTTVSQALTFAWTFGTANAGNTVTLRAARVEQL